MGPSPVGKLTNLTPGENLWKMMRKDLLWTEAKDIWHIFLDPVWADFHGTPAAGNRPIPLVDAFPVSLWLYKEPEEVHEKKKTQDSKPQAKMHILGTVNSLISVQLNHYQLLFLMRMIEMIGEISAFLNEDVTHILGEEDEGSVAVGLMAPQIDVSLLMPAVSQSR